MKILIKNGRVIDPKNNIDTKLDVLIANGIIKEIGQISDSDATVIDATDKIVAPGLIDMHCHLREPGQEYKEDIETGSKSAVKGGFTTVACMPNTSPTIDSVEVIEYIKNRAKSVGYANVLPIASVTKGLAGIELCDFDTLKNADAVAFSDDGLPVNDSLTMRNAMEKAYSINVPIISHCEDMSILNGGCMNEGETSKKLGFKGISRASEEIMVSRDIIIAKSAGVAVHIAHVSTRGSVELVRQAKKQGVQVTCETCPHYFSLTDEAVEKLGGNAKMNPPLRTFDDVIAIIEGLKDGTIDAIATDHAPHSEKEKMCDFTKAANGIVGFETALSLGITYLVDSGALTINQLIEKMTCNPADILKINKGDLSVGSDADVVIIDESQSHIVDTELFASKSKNSPFGGMSLKGRVLYTIVGGEIKCQWTL